MKGKDAGSPTAAWALAGLCATFSSYSLPASADETPAATDQAPATTAPAAPPSAYPAMVGMAPAPLTTNPKPPSYDTGSVLGTVYVSSALSGLAQWQDHVAPGDLVNQGDLSNGQFLLNKGDGLVQYFLQAGAYSIPDLGLPYVKASDATRGLFGPVPAWFVKLAPNDKLSIQAGKLPTLIGAEYTFSFENMNIERGLLWNQENAVNRGVQVNYAAGPVALSASWNDGFYSNKYSWAWLSAAWTIGKTDTLAFIAGGNTRRTSVSTFATPLYQNNEQIYNLIYTRTQGPWTIEPYLQYTYVPSTPAIGAYHAADTFGAALLVNYAVSAIVGLNVPARVEYISSTGSTVNGAPNLLYGPGSKAWSVTVTPTYQRGVFFVRAELSYVGARDTTPGLVFGPAGNDTSQTRALLEVGGLF